MSRWCRLGDRALVCSVALFLPIKLAFLGLGVVGWVWAGNEKEAGVMMKVLRRRWGGGREVEGGRGGRARAGDSDSDVLLAKMLSSIAAI